MYLRRRTIFKISILFVILVTGYLFRFQILRALGNHLIVEDELSQSDAVFVLSGNSYDRGNEAARIHLAGYAPLVVCLGGETSGVLEDYGLLVKNCDIIRKVVLKAGVDSSRVETLCKGSSTYEEFQAIGEYCKQRGMKKVIVVSSDFHTRRIDSFFRGRMEEQGVEMVLRGASSSNFDEQEWWKSEEGLIFLNNEYVKYFYYLLKY